MALPQIQRAQVIQAPGVFDYAMREGPNIAQAFTSGLSAGIRMKEAKTAEKNREADKLDREKSKKQTFEMEFGQDIITNPQTGEVDIPASREAQNKRKQQEQFAGSAGESYAGGISMDGLTPEIMESPAFKAGVARGMAKIQQEEALLGRITKREEEAQKRQMEIQRIEQEGRQKIEQDRNQARFLETILGGGGRPASGAPPSDTSVRYTDPDTGAVYTFKSQEAYDKWRGKAPETQDAGPDPDYTKAARDAIKQFDALQARGVPAKLEIDNAGIPKVTPKSGVWDFFSTEATPETIDALRRKVNPRAQPAARAPVPLNSVIR